MRIQNKLIQQPKKSNLQPLASILQILEDEMNLC